MRTRWIVTHIPFEQQKALAIKRGYKETADNESIWDFVEPDECEISLGPYLNITLAFRRAKPLVPLDAVGEVRIIRQCFVDTEDGPGYWDDQEYWLVYHDTETVDVKKPDGRYEVLS